MQDFFSKLWWVGIQNHISIILFPKKANINIQFEKKLHQFLNSVISEHYPLTFVWQKHIGEMPHLSLCCFFHDIYMYQLPLPWVFLFWFWVHCTEIFSLVIPITWTVLLDVNPTVAVTVLRFLLYHTIANAMSWSNYVVLNIYHNFGLCKTKCPLHSNCQWKSIFQCPSSCQNEGYFITNHLKNMPHHHLLRVESPNNMVNILQNIDTQLLFQQCEIFLHFQFGGFLQKSIALCVISLAKPFGVLEYMSNYTTHTNCRWYYLSMP